MSQISKCPKLRVVLGYWEALGEVSELRYKNLLYISSKRSYCMNRSSESQQKPYKCIICCIRFKHEKSLHAHRQREHSIVRRFKCLKCDQNFETMKSLREHAWMTNHKKEGVNFGSDFKVRRTLPIRFSPNEVLAFVAKKADKEMGKPTEKRSTEEVSGLVNIGSPSSRDTVPHKIHMVL